METHSYGGDYQSLVLQTLHNFLKTLGEVSGEGDSMLLVPHPHLEYRNALGVPTRMQRKNFWFVLVENSPIRHKLMSVAVVCFCAYFFCTCSIYLLQCFRT
jgi:hypothetical protein